MEVFSPSYLELSSKGELEIRANEAYKHLAICDVCALHCPVDRLGGRLGRCRTGVKARVSSFAPHHFEERPLSGWNGSGTIFFTGCNLHCQYCQNYAISQTDNGDEVDPINLADMMLQLQSMGCHNINFVSPSHVVPQIIAAVNIAAQAGLNIPLVYNTGGYDSIAMLQLLDGIIDIYMPDMKYGDAIIAKKYSKVIDYPKINQAAVLEMHRQVGDLQVNMDGIAVRGLLVRHLILPNGLAGTEQVVKYLANFISKDTYLNLMDQYHPAYRASQYPELTQPINSDDYLSAYRIACETGLHRFDKVINGNAFA